MKLDKSGIFIIAERLKESRTILERAHLRISQSLEGLRELQEPVAKATLILRNVPKQ